MAKNIQMKARQFRHKRIIIDTSVLVKFFLPEKGSKIVDELIAMNMRKELALLSTKLLVFEFLNVLSKNIKDPGQVQTAYKKFKEAGIGMIEMEDVYTYVAIDAACRNQKVSYYDAAYHAMALDMDGVFLTADERYYRLMKNKGHVELFG